MLLALLAACKPEPSAPPVVRTPPEGEPAMAFAGERPTNLLVISIDTTRRDHVDRWATDGVVRTPFLASLFETGVVLDDHVQCSNWTFAATSCTNRGKLMEETGFYPKLNTNTREPLPEGQHTLASRLVEHGYATAMVSSNEWLSPTWNNAEGFQQFSRLTTANTGALMDEGLRLLRELDAGEAPWFVHVHLVEPHPPYTPPVLYAPDLLSLPPAPWDLDSQKGQYDAADEWPELTPAEQDLLVRHLEARYSGELRYLDAQLEERWATLRDEGFLDETLVAVWNDHGEQFFEHGQQAHAYGLGAEENDAFLAFLADGLAPRAWSEPTHAVDFVPTVLDALGFPAEDPLLAGYVLGTAPEGRPRFAATAARNGPQVTVLDGPWKMTYDLDGGWVRMWNRADDPREQRDLFDADDPKAVELWELLRPRAELLAPLSTEYGITWPSGLDAP